MKKPVKMKKMAKGGTLAPSKTSTSTNLASYKRTIGKNTSGKGKMKTCKMGC
jgi:hypothetical protein